MKNAPFPKSPLEDAPNQMPEEEAQIRMLATKMGYLKAGRTLYFVLPNSA